MGNQVFQVHQVKPVFQVSRVNQETEVQPVIVVQWVQLEHQVQSVHQGFVIQSSVFQVVLTVLLLLAKKVTPKKTMMLNLVMLILLNKTKATPSIFSTSISISIPTLDTYNATVLLIFTILLQIILLHPHYHYCFLVQWTTQMVTILESRCPIFISM